MTFESGERRFVISRRFDRYGKHADLVCQTDGEILSVEQGDMDMLLDGMSEAAFENTISIGQTKSGDKRRAWCRIAELCGKLL